MTMTADPNITPGTTALNTHLNNLISAINTSTTNVFLANADITSLPSSVKKGELIEKIDFNGINTALEAMEGVCSNCATYSTFVDTNGTVCATNTTYGNTCTTNSTNTDGCATNSTWAESPAGNSTWAESPAGNSTWAESLTYDTWSDNLSYDTWAESFTYSTEITGTEYVTENADMSIASGKYSYSCTNYCATNTTWATYSESPENATWAESLSYTTWSEEADYTTWSEELSYTTWSEELSYTTNSDDLIYATNSEALIYSTYNNTNACQTNATFSVA